MNSQEQNPTTAELEAVRRVFTSSNNSEVSQPSLLRRLYVEHEIGAWRATEVIAHFEANRLGGCEEGAGTKTNTAGGYFQEQGWAGVCRNATRNQIRASTASAAKTNHS